MMQFNIIISDILQKQKENNLNETFHDCIMPLENVYYAIYRQKNALSYCIMSSSLLFPS